MQHRLRQASLGERLRDDGAAADRGAWIRLRDDGVADRQRRCHGAHREVEREVERRDVPDHPERQTPIQADATAAAGQHQPLCLRRHRRGFAQAADRGAQLEFGLGAHRAAFPHDPVGELRRMSFGQLRRLPEDPGAGLETGLGPAKLRLPCHRGRTGNLLVTDEADAADHLARGRFNHIGRSPEAFPTSYESRAVPHRLVQPPRLRQRRSAHSCSLGSWLHRSRPGQDERVGTSISTGPWQARAFIKTSRSWPGVLACSARTP